ncbi:DUF4493 domain-containing protein [Phocaeicola barnesiae]|uniref:DUF4493 domain-containing protein n=1 Tax=Phocaeicola barnesiae TaxID=376804 RepID=UPI00266F2B80|nr:DUF4493 domain-containing protein [Phocaeicola barnesiae]
MRYIKVFYTGLIGLLLVACTNDTFDSENGEGTGYLRLALGSIDVELSSTSRAEAVSLPTDLIPQTYDDFMIDIKQGNYSVEGFPKEYSQLSEEGIELMAGAYTVTAYYGENEPIQETPYFSGSSTIQINPGQSTSTTINATLANAMLTPAVSTSLQNHYSAWTLTVKSGDVSMTLAEKDKSDGYLFAKAEQPVNAVFEGTNLLGKETSQEWTVISSAAAQTKYVIQCEPDLSIFSNIQLTATATHTYAEGTLTGTDVALNLAANGAPLELVDGWNIQLLYNNTAIRSYTDKPENGTLMEVTNGWPYVPQGSTLMASIHLQTGETINLTSVAMEEIPAPEFTATVSGNTSYSVYKSSGADAANTKDGSSIFDINATATIASEISGNPNYSDILKVTYTTDSGQSSEELPFGTATLFNSLAWQKHALSATVSFDGVEKTSLPVECDVTGLPYTLKHPANNYGWYTIEGNAIQYNDNHIHLETWSPEPTVGSPSFHIPENLDFSLSCQYEKNTKSTFSSYTFYVEMLKPEDHSRHGEICSHKGKDKGIYNLSGNGSFTSEINAISCRYGYSAIGNSVSVISIQINYR